MTRSACCPARPMSTGKYGLDGLYVGVPVIIGNDGVEQIVEIELDAEAKTNLRGHRSSAVKELLVACKAHRSAARLRTPVGRPPSARRPGEGDATTPRCRSSSTRTPRSSPQGHDRQHRHLPHRAGAGLRHADGRAASPRARAAPPISACPNFDTVQEAVTPPAPTRRDLRAAALRCGLDPRSNRRRSAADRDDHRRHPGARHGSRQARADRVPSRA